MQAIILAAGMGRRLGALTADNTKCMIPVNGTRLIDRMLRQLRQLGITQAVIVTGYKGDNLRRHILSLPDDVRPPVIFIDNADFATTNNIHSLWMARDYLAADDTLLLESDIILDDNILQQLIDSPVDDVALVDKYQPWMDGTMVRIDAATNHIVNFVPKQAFSYADIDSYYKTVNVYKLSRRFSTTQYLPFLQAYIAAMGQNEYYEQVLRVLTTIDSTSLKALPLTAGSHWYEIDDVQDLRIAEVLFAEPELKLSKLHSSYGGYWRYPGLIDFCYLVNPYYPTPRMVSEMQSNFDSLLRNYPSGTDINTLLAAKFFAIKQDYTAIGNGAAELINALMSSAASRGNRVGLILPSFEEYYNRLPTDNIVAMTVTDSSFRYTASDIIGYFGDKAIDTLLIVNPDNPSGNLIDRTGLTQLLSWSASRGIRLIIDESFIDFSSSRDATTLLDDCTLRANPHLVVIKSISKSYGVPGLRLGIAASADSSTIGELRHNCSIWNINSFAEYYLQIAGKYEADYLRASQNIIAARDAMFVGLQRLQPSLTVLPSDANYFLCSLNHPRYTAHTLAVELLDRFNILIKDCTSKRGIPIDGQYIRIAVRDTADNDTLINALEQLLS